MAGVGPERLRADLVEAVAAVEEANRVKGFAAAVGRFDAEGTTFEVVMARVRDESAGAASQHIPDRRRVLRLPARGVIVLPCVRCVGDRAGCG